MTPTPIVADVVVIGAGSAGVAAAVGAARKGASVVLIEANDYPGGKATAAMVGTVCGLYHTGPAKSAQWAVSGIAREFAEALAKESRSEPENFHGELFFLPYSIDAFKRVCLHYLESEKVQCFWGASVMAVSSNEHGLTSLLVNNGIEKLTVQAATFVDCTGEAVVSQLVSPDWVEGGDNQAAARVFQLSGMKKIPSEAIHFALTLAMRRGIESGKIDPIYQGLSVVPGSFRAGAACFKLALPGVVTNDPIQRSEMLTESETLVREVTAYLSQQTEAFAGVHLTDLAPEVGFRTGYRPKGRYTLTESDVLDTRPHPEGIANGAWPIEYWQPGEQVEMAYFDEGSVYQIPAGCVESRYAKNLYFAGRNLSATPRAQASARVMGTCLQTGYAAGVLAAAKALGKGRTSAIGEIRKELDIA